MSDTLFHRRLNFVRPPLSHFESAPRSVDDPLARLVAPLSPMLAPIRLRRAWRVAIAAQGYEPEFSGMDDAALRGRRRLLSTRLRRGTADDAVVAQVIALAREACRRKCGLSMYVEQMAAGYALYRGGAVEMDTGEGKTLTSLIPSAIHALSGQSTHVVAPNDYLAGRDGELLRPALEGLGCSVGIIGHELTAEQRREAYACNVTFVSNKEVAFDYLRDRLLTDAVIGDTNVHHKTQRFLAPIESKKPIIPTLDVAIVDEIDSVLIDDASTPLLISAQDEVEIDSDVAGRVMQFAMTMESGRHFKTDPHSVGVEFTDQGSEMVDQFGERLGGIWQQRIRRHEIIRAAVTAQHCLQRDQHYLVDGARIVIVDTNSGRSMPDRYWGHYLHQMVELKEGCETTGKRKSLASITFQRFFLAYRKLAGMSGTVREVAAELNRVYGLSLVRIPRRRPLQREFLGRKVFEGRVPLWSAVADAVEEFSRSGRPVLIGVRSVAEANRGSRALADRGISHSVLSAAHDKGEAEVVAQAGNRGTVTIATNMAGRGTDIKLGEGARERGGLVVMMCERHDYRRIDRQLMGRGARQGDPGAVIEFVSRDDQVLKANPLLTRLGRVQRLGHFTIVAALRLAQWHAERVQARRRLELVRRDESLQKMLAFAGGLD